MKRSSMFMVSLVAILLSNGAHAQIMKVTIEPGTFCNLIFKNVKYTSGQVIGHRDAMLEFMTRFSDVEVNSCEWALMGSPGGEAEYIIEKFGEPTEEFGFLPKNKLLVKLDSPERFIATMQAMQRQEAVPAPAPQGAPSGGDVPPPASAEVTWEPRESTKKQDECKWNGNICFDAEGVASATVGCGPLNVTVSTEGDLSISMSDGPISSGIDIQR
jgi:hypothetical protein